MAYYPNTSNYERVQGTENSKTTKQIILDAIEDLVSDFLYYDRKGDEDLSIEQLKKAVTENEITIDEIVVAFKKHLEDSFKNL